MSETNETVLCPHFPGELPRVLDMRDCCRVIQLIEALVIDEVRQSTGYLGAILFGSLSVMMAHNQSDIDVVHVVKSDEYYLKKGDGIIERMDAVFGEGFRIFIDQFSVALDLLSTDTREHVSFLRLCKYLDRQSVLIIPDAQVKSRVVQIGAFSRNEHIYKIKNKNRDAPAHIWRRN